jgi:ABC-type dipeptide/oligopeptide/nickel transport system permease component
MKGSASGFWIFLRGVATLLVTLAGLLFATFIIGRVMPIDPVIAVVGDKASQETYARAREEMGLDRPIWVQFGRYIEGIVQGDLGQSSMPRIAATPGSTIRHACCRCSVIPRRSSGSG